MSGFFGPWVDVLGLYIDLFLPIEPDRWTKEHCWWQDRGLYVILLIRRLPRTSVLLLCTEETEKAIPALYGGLSGLTYYPFLKDSDLPTSPILSELSGDT